MHAGIVLLVNPVSMKRITPAILLILLFFFHTFSFAQKWDNIYGYPGTHESFKDLIETYDKGYLISGSHEQEHGNWLIKTDINGNILWEKIIKWSGGKVFRTSIDQSQNSNLFAASNTSGSLLGQWPLITKLNPCGEKLWCRVFQPEGFDWGWFDDLLVLDNGDVIALAFF